MKKTWLLVAALPAFASLVAPSRAAASTISGCQAGLKTLSLRTEDMLFLRGDQGQKAQAQLVLLVSKAASELDKLGFKEAMKQLDAYSAELSRAVASGKIRPDDAVVLQEGANDVIRCIGAIGR